LDVKQEESSLSRLERPPSLQGLSRSPGVRRWGEKGEDVSANEDLMREHGVLRRAVTGLFSRARPSCEPIRPAFLPLRSTKPQCVFRQFGED